MKTVAVRSQKGNYSILIGASLLPQTGTALKSLGLRGKAMIVTQEKIASHYVSPLQASLRKSGIDSVIYLLPDGEEGKSQRELFRLYHALLDQDFERKDFIIALGGGVVGDLSGFAAATFLRGIAFCNIATTLLAQIDSAIGGKTGINLDEGKNLIGAFYPPKLVISDTNVFKTLPQREYQASLGEAVKYGVIRDAKFFRFFETQRKAILERNLTAVSKIVYVSSKIKADVVSRDEFETQGLRMILNFGHTFAHGIERELHYRKLFHGEAVAIGMMCASRLARKLKMFDAKSEERLLNLLLSFHLPASFSGLGLYARDLMESMTHDKKKKGGKLRFVLPVALGKVVVREGISDKIVSNVLVELGAK